MAVKSDILHQQVSRHYLEEQLSGLAPIPLLVRVYDAAIISCIREDRDRLSRALVELISSLNFQYQEVALGLFRLYSYCLREGKKGNFDKVKPIMVELRDAWVEAEKSTQSS